MFRTPEVLPDGMRRRTAAMPWAELRAENCVRPWRSGGLYHLLCLLHQGSRECLLLLLSQRESLREHSGKAGKEGLVWGAKQ